MKKLILLLAFSILLLGCLQGNGSKKNETVVELPDNNTTVETRVTIGSEENHSVVGSREDRNATDQHTTTQPISIDYTFNPSETIYAFFFPIASGNSQGDAILVNKGDADILVDSGPQESAATLVNSLHAKGVDDIEILILTKADPEHYGGASTLLDNYRVEELWWSGNTFGDEQFAAVIAKAREKGISLKTVHEGTNFTLNGMAINVLNPPISNSFADRDNSGVVLRLSDRNFSMLLTSDIRSGAQGKIVSNKKLIVSAAVLQIPNHGIESNQLSITLFLDAVHPKFAIISGGQSDPRETRSAVLNLLKMKGIPLYQNYIEGTVKVISDGSEIVVTTEGS